MENNSQSEKDSSPDSTSLESQPVSADAELVALCLSSYTIDGTAGEILTGTVILHQEAPFGGVQVALALMDTVPSLPTSFTNLTNENTNGVTIPDSVKVDAGSSIGSFTVKTSPVASSRTITIAARFQEVIRYATLTLRVVPPGVAITDLILIPSIMPSVCGWNDSWLGVVTISRSSTQEARDQEVSICLACDHSAAMVPKNVLIAADKTSAVFPVELLRSKFFGLFKHLTSIIQKASSARYTAPTEEFWHWKYPKTRSGQRRGKKPYYALTLVRIVRKNIKDGDDNGTLKEVHLATGETAKTAKDLRVNEDLRPNEVVITASLGADLSLKAKLQILRHRSVLPRWLVERRKRLFWAYQQIIDSVCGSCALHPHDIQDIEAFLKAFVQEMSGSRSQFSMQTNLAAYVRGLLHCQTLQIIADFERTGLFRPQAASWVLFDLNRLISGELLDVPDFAPLDAQTTKKSQTATKSQSVGEDQNDHVADRDEAKRTDKIISTNAQMPTPLRNRLMLEEIFPLSIATYLGHSRSFARLRELLQSGSFLLRFSPMHTVLQGRTKQIGKLFGAVLPIPTSSKFWTAIVWISGLLLVVWFHLHQPGNSLEEIYSKQAFEKPCDLLWSNDEQVVFVSHDRDVPQVMSLALTSSGETEAKPFVYPHLPNARVLDAAWSKDGSRIAAILADHDRPLLVVWEPQYPERYGELRLNSCTPADVEAMTWMSLNDTDGIGVFYNTPVGSGFQYFKLLRNRRSVAATKADTEKADTEKADIQLASSESLSLNHALPGFKEPIWNGPASPNPKNASQIVVSVAEKGTQQSGIKTEGIQHKTEYIEHVCLLDFDNSTQSLNTSIGRTLSHGTSSRSPGSLVPGVISQPMGQWVLRTVPLGPIMHPEQPSWSADGQSVFFQGDAWTVASKIPVLGSKDKPTIWATAQRPSWSPNWKSDLYSATIPLHGQDLRIDPTSSPNVFPIASNGCRYPVGTGLTISDDLHEMGSYMFYVSEMNHDTSGIWVYSVAQGTSREITYDENIAARPLVFGAADMLYVSTVSLEKGEKFDTVQYRIRTRVVSKEDLLTSFQSRSGTKHGVMELLNSLHML